MQYHEAKQSNQTRLQFESGKFALLFANNTRSHSGYYESKVRIENRDNSVFPEAVIFCLCYPLTKVKLLSVFTESHVFPFRS
jgi:hypothetical protein